MSRQKKVVTMTGATGFVGRGVVNRLLEEYGVTTRFLFGTLEQRLSEREMLALNIVYWEMLTRIEEPSIDAYTSNMAESMLCSSVMLAALTSLGLEHQNLAALGRAVGDRSGAGIKSCLRNLQNAVNEGLYPQGQALFAKHSANDLTRGLVSENVDDLGEVED